MIKPTVGRVVLYRPSRFDPGEPGEVQAAIIARVHNDTCVNLMVIAPGGMPYPRTSVYLLQEGNESPGVPYAEWMDYQKGQAAKTEQLEAKLEALTEK